MNFYPSTTQEFLLYQLNQVIYLSTEWWKLKEILENRGIRMEMVRDETLEIKAKYGDERRTDIDYSSGNIDITDLIPDESVVITISHLGPFVLVISMLQSLTTVSLILS